MSNGSQAGRAIPEASPVVLRRVVRLWNVDIEPEPLGARRAVDVPVEARVMSRIVIPDRMIRIMMKRLK